MIDLPLVIGDGRRPAAGLAVRNPARPAEVVGYAPVAGPGDVDAAVRSAHAAAGGWGALPWEGRAARLRDAADLLAADQAEWSRLLVRETGKTHAEAAMELARTTRRFRQTADLADAGADVGYPDSITLRAPYGVAALIVPWNWPLSILAAKLPQALLAGNTAVIKPSPLAPLTTLLFAQRLATLLTPGVVNAVSGAAETGADLVGHPLVGRIDFTGSTATGRLVAALAAPHLTPLTLELGGNDAAIVRSDADLGEPALRRLARAAYAAAGQVCMAVKRLYVHRSVYREVVDGLRDVLAETVVGDGLAPDSTMGPVITAAARDRITGLLGTVGDATVHRLGRARDRAEFDRGHFLLPSLVTGIGQDAPLVQQEQFGPALPVLPFDTDDEAVALAGDTRYGLSASIWSTDLDRAAVLARRLRVGTVYLNGHGPAAQDDHAPFGGTRDSGYGRQLGRTGVLGFTAEQTITTWKDRP